MPIDLAVLGRRIDPSRTVLLFGAGSSIPSGAPSSKELVDSLASKFGVEGGAELSLSDLATIIEASSRRREMVEELSERLQNLNPARGLLMLPEFEWASLFTTNYDDLIEKSYRRFGKPLRVYSSNFDFNTNHNEQAVPLYKLHGTKGSDISLGHQHRMILSNRDYDLTSDYRECLYAALADQLLTKSVLVIGQSLVDPDLRGLVDSAIRVKSQKGAPGTITILSYERNENRAVIYESRGLDVCFAGIDEFFDEMAKGLSDTNLLPGITDDPLDRSRVLHPATTDVSVAKAQQTGALSKMFAGRAASYADIVRGWTFDREFADRLETQMAETQSKRIAYVIGSAGTGKTTGVRQALCRLSDRGFYCWEHAEGFEFQSSAWEAVDDELRKRKETGVLFIDDAHNHLHRINVLVDSICKHEVPALKLILVSSKPNWNPRLKTPLIFSCGESYEVGTLSDREIDSLLDLLDGSQEIARMVEKSFLGFSRSERQRRLSDRCHSDMFVCLKNIFASESFDDIILREFAELNVDYQDVYKRIAGMESAGIRVHRQLVLRTVNIQPNQVERVLSDLEGLIEERTISERDGVYAWSVRHGVIADIVSRYKIPEENDFYDLLDCAIENLNPTYKIELISMDEICSPRGGFARVKDRRKQNVLLRKMMSAAPTRRVPRHRLITNLINLHEYDSAQTEIRLFENEIRIDGPVQRYKVKLRLERARHTIGIMDEDRAAIVREAAGLAEAGLEKFTDDKNMYDIYLECGVAHFRYTKSLDIFDAAMQAARDAYERILDPDLMRTITKFERVSHQFGV